MVYTKTARDVYRTAIAPLHFVIGKIQRRRIDGQTWWGPAARPEILTAPEVMIPLFLQREDTG
jgi:hypothetical protein